MNKRTLIVILTSDEFKKQLSSMMPLYYSYTDDDKDQVMEKLTRQVSRLKNGIIEIVPYKSSWFTRKVIGHVKNGNKTQIFFNTRHDFDEVKLARLIYHEILHWAGYGHGGNCMRWYCNPWKKLKSVNYALEDHVEESLLRSR